MYKVIIDKMSNEIACIIRELDKTAIPPYEGNADYQQYLEWVAEGNVAEEVNNGM